MKISDVLRGLIDVVDNHSDESPVVAGQEENTSFTGSLKPVTLPDVKSQVRVEKGETTPAGNAEQPEELFLPPLQMKMELLKKAVEVENVYDDGTPEQQEETRQEADGEWTGPEHHYEYVGAQTGVVEGGSKDTTNKEESMSESIRNTLDRMSKIAEEKADKDYDGDGEVESEKDEVWGSRMKAAKKAGKMDESHSETMRDLLDRLNEAEPEWETRRKETWANTPWKMKHDEYDKKDIVYSTAPGDDREWAFDDYTDNADAFLDYLVNGGEPPKPQSQWSDYDWDHWDPMPEGDAEELDEAEDKVMGSRMKAAKKAGKLAEAGRPLKPVSELRNRYESMDSVMWSEERGAEVPVEVFYSATMEGPPDNHWGYAEPELEWNLIDVRDAKTGERVDWTEEDYELFLDEFKDANGLSESLNERGEPADEEAVRELVLFADNDGNLYRQSYEPIIKNLQKKVAKGVYDPAMAVKLWGYHADRAAQAYAREFGGQWNQMFNPATRRAAAQQFEEQAREEIGADQLNELSPKTLKSYLAKAEPSAQKHFDLATKAAGRAARGGSAESDRFMKHSEKFGKRKAGIDRAMDQLDEMCDDECQLDELSKSTLVNYMRANTKRMADPKNPDSMERKMKRHDDYFRASKKFHDEEPLKEGRIDPVEAYEILDSLGLLGRDFFELSNDEVNDLMDHAKRLGYKSDRRTAPGSPARMFFQYLTRMADGVAKRRAARGISEAGYHDADFVDKSSRLERLRALAKRQGDREKFDLYNDELKKLYGSDHYTPGGDFDNKKAYEDCGMSRLKELAGLGEGDDDFDDDSFEPSSFDLGFDADEDYEDDYSDDLSDFGYQKDDDEELWEDKELKRIKELAVANKGINPVILDALTDDLPE